MPAKDSKPKLLFRSVGKDEAPLYHIMGARGGPSADGSVIMWVYMDTAALPGDLVGEPDDQGKVKFPPEEPAIDRRFQCGLIMSSENAKVIGEWLQNQGDKADALRQSITAFKSAKPKK
jgi:hypothetical protein